MATSSITYDFFISDKQSVERFAKALEAQQAPQSEAQPQASSQHRQADHKDFQALLRKLKNDA